MKKYNPENERIKRSYFTFLKEAKRHSEPTIDAAAKALHRFESYTGHRDFKAFHFQQAVAFKKHLTGQKAEKSDRPLSKATLHSTMSQLKRFFQWLALQPGCKSRLQYADAEYFNLSDKDTRIATAKRQQKVPTMQQIKHVLDIMPTATEIDRRNRALFAFILLTGARDSAAASIKLKHLDMTEGCVHQDAREVKTKRSKTFSIYFFPVGADILAIVAEWAAYLRHEKLLGNRANSRRLDWSGRTGAQQPRSAPFSAMPSPLPGCRISTRTASAILLSGLVRKSARPRSSSRRGARI